jgi:1,4-alpha-glucan branching enzyme
VEGYHPITGKRDRFVPAREYMKAHIAHWIDYYRVDGLRLDSVNNIANYDFLQEFRDYARSLWAFEWSVRKLIDCRLLGFSDGSQAVNYVTSHDVEGFGNERLYNYLENSGIVYKEKYIKLAFVCLLTAVGVPMILAGEEFADEHDLSPDEVKDKQVDPVNYQRLNDGWRKDIFNYVAKLVHWRTTAKALAVNETQFIHVDFNDGKRVLVWQRGSGEDLVVVVANFSDYSSPIFAEYIVPNWPAAVPGKQWREVTQDRVVPNDKAGKEPIFSWEAKVYALV